MDLGKISFLLILILPIIFAHNGCLCPNEKSELLIPNIIQTFNDKLERLVIYLYKDGNDILLYVPGLTKQRLIPDLELSPEDNINPIMFETVSDVFAANQDNCIPIKVLKHPKLEYLYPELPNNYPTDVENHSKLNNLPNFDESNTHIDAMNEPHNDFIHKPTSKEHMHENNPFKPNTNDETIVHPHDKGNSHSIESYIHKPDSKSNNFPFIDKKVKKKMRTDRIPNVESSIEMERSNIDPNFDDDDAPGHVMHNIHKSNMEKDWPYLDATPIMESDSISAKNTIPKLFKAHAHSAKNPKIKHYDNIFDHNFAIQSDNKKLRPDIKHLEDPNNNVPHTHHNVFHVDTVPDGNINKKLLTNTPKHVKLISKPHNNKKTKLALNLNVSSEEESTEFYLHEELNRPSLSIENDSSSDEIHTKPGDEDYVTFDKWFLTQMNMFKAEDPNLDLNSTGKYILNILHDNGMHVSPDGILTDSHGTVLSVQNLKLRPILIGSSMRFDKFINKLDKRPSSTGKYLQSVLVTNDHPPKILGIIPLGKTYLPMKSLNIFWRGKDYKHQNRLRKPINLNLNLEISRNHGNDPSSVTPKIQNKRNFTYDLTKYLKEPISNKLMKMIGNKPLFEPKDALKMNPVRHQRKSQPLVSKLYQGLNFYVPKFINRPISIKHINDVIDIENISEETEEIYSEENDSFEYSEYEHDNFEYSSSEETIDLELENQQDEVKTLTTGINDAGINKVAIDKILNGNLANVTTIETDDDLISETSEEEDDDELDYRIIGGNAATSSGTPVSNKGRSGYYG